MKLRKVLVVYYVHNYATLETVKRVLSKNRISYKCINRRKVEKGLINGKDLVIVVGGDGTFLRTSHMIGKIPVFSVSSDARYNEAFYGRAFKDDFEKKINIILKGRNRITKLPRLEAKINGKKLPMLAVNEIFVGSSHMYHTSRYILNVRGKKEFQKSSGVLITTNCGSSGWAKSAAKKKFTVPKNGLGYVVREPYTGRLTKPKLLQGALSPREKVVVKSLIHHGIVVADSSDREFRFVDGDKLEVTISKSPLNFVEF